MGMGNDPRYNKSRCLETFPFPVATVEQQARVRDLAEQLDAQRKRVLAEHDDLTLTGLYNVLEKLRAGQPLNDKEKYIHERGLVAVLLSLHDELDAAVLNAYGWDDLALRHAHGERDISAVLLERLVALNAARVAEEAAGTVRWLRPEFQNPSAPPVQAPVVAEQPTPPLAVPATEPPVKATSAASGASGVSSAKSAWPATLPEQVAAVARVLGSESGALSFDAIAARFSGRGKWKARLPQILDTLVALGRARRLDDGRFGAER